MAADFWQQWHEFEVKHGNEDTFKEMLRIKRSVQLQFNTEVNLLSAQIQAGRDKQEQQQQPQIKFKPATQTTGFIPSNTDKNNESADKTNNTHQIDLALSDEDDEN
jgi:pre-mRNA-splicing factor SYF1